MCLVRPPKVKGRADIFPIIYGAHAHIHARTHYGAEADLRYAPKWLSCTWWS